MGVLLWVVLSVWKLRVGAENYYLAEVASGVEDYYSGRGEAPGRWLGLATSGLGLDVGGIVGGDGLRAVLAGLQPGTGQSPNGGPPRVWKGRVSGFDLTFSAPKSVSVLYALGDPVVVSDVLAAVDVAVDEAVGWLERETCFVRRGSNNRAAASGPSAEFGTRRLRGDGFVAAAFRHRTSRAGDPQLHTHVLVANLTRGPDLRWSALDAQGLYRSKMAAGAVYRAVLTAELTRRLGVTWRPAGKGLVEIAGIPQTVLELFSKRRAEIEAHMAADGVAGAEAARAATLATRTRKADIDPVALRERWIDEAHSVGYSPADITQLVDINPNPQSLDTVEMVLPITDPDTGITIEQHAHSAAFARLVADRITTTDSTATRHEILSIVAEALPAGIGAERIEQITRWVLAHHELIPISQPTTAAAPAGGWEQRWTSRRLVALERGLLDAYQTRASTPPPPPEHVEAAVATAAVTLGDDQAAAVLQLCGDAGLVSVLVGRAGTGKTFTLAVVREAYRRAGRRMVGVAPSARAARELADGAGIDAYTFPRFARHAAPTLAAGDLVVVDEAGMAGTVDLHQVVVGCRRVGAKVILVGDHLQLPEVAAGGGFAAAVTTRRLDVAELTVNRRQHAVWEHAALDHLRHGRPLEGFRAYQDHDRVHLAATTSDVHTEAVEGWLTAHRNGVDAVLLAGTRAEAAALNRLARTAVDGELSGPVLSVRGRSFQVGDRVVLLQNGSGRAGHVDLGTGRSCSVDNGMLATITAVDLDHSGLDIELVNGRRLRLDGGYVLDGHVDHGYAATIHKAQGVTCDQVHLVGPSGLYREAVYVAMSRGRHAAHIYATHTQVAELTERAHTTGIPLPDEHPDDLDADLQRALHTSRAKQFAITTSRHLDIAADLATIHHLDTLLDRHATLRAVFAHLRADGYTDPGTALARLERTVEHRRRLAVGVHVNAADRDNVGTITAIDDAAGACVVTFTSPTGRSAHKLLEWADLTPVGDTEPVDLTPEAVNYLGRLQAAVDDEVTVWNRALSSAGIDPDELHTIPTAVSIRRERLAHHLAANPPGWLDHMYGPRPSDPAGAQVWDHEISHLAAWRDHQHLHPNIAGWGSRPDDHGLAVRWDEHLDRSINTADWLRTHHPAPPRAIDPNQIDIAAVRARLGELEQLLATAPPDQTRIIDALRTGDLQPADIHQALLDAVATQDHRRAWILEHWPHVVEHHELTKISAAYDPLSHWPSADTAGIDQLLERLAARSRDSFDTTPLHELDQRLIEADPNEQRARLQRERDTLHERIKSYTGIRDDVDDDHRQVLDQRVHRLRQRINGIGDQLHRLAAHAILHSYGYGPAANIRTAIEHRANHLAHTAITTHEPWIRQTLSRSDLPAEVSIERLHRIITDVAAWRERHHIEGPDPLGAQPSDPDTITAWTQLDRQLQHYADIPQPVPTIDLHPTL